MGAKLLTVLVAWYSTFVVIRARLADAFNLQALELGMRYSSEAPLMYATVPKIIRSRGYRCEEIQVESEDGYLITIHRIPYGRKSDKQAKRGPVILHHGLLSSSASWTVTDSEQGLGYLLADAGYDVWMPNSRGNLYSQKNVKIPKSAGKKFWGFSWDEMAYYDIPAIIDFVLKETNVEKVHYVGHSMGTTIFFAAMALRPEYNAKIKLMSALAPVAYLHDIRGALAIFGPHWKTILSTSEKFGVYEFAPYNKGFSVVGNVICAILPRFIHWCDDFEFIIVGYDRPQLNKTLFPYVVGQHPAGASVYTTIHYAQQMMSGKFCRFDYGQAENLRRYNQVTPPSYNVSKITVPVALYYGKNDYLATPKSVLHLANELPNLVRIRQIQFEYFNHIDFLFAKDMVHLVNTPVMELMEQY